ncbi:MAG: hypothetical protein V2G41_10115 [bacterium JZ-2024 1]
MYHLASISDGTRTRHVIATTERLCAIAIAQILGEWRQYDFGRRIEVARKQASEIIVDATDPATLRDPHRLDPARREDFARVIDLVATGIAII